MPGRRTGYDVPFWLEGPVGNNAFAFDARGANPRLFVPSIVSGTFADVRPGSETAFEEVDDDGVLRSCTGLAHFVRTTWRGVPTIVVDNHNHAFYFWFEAIAQGRLKAGATLVHLDQHRDTRIPARSLDHDATPADAFVYTNEVLNVGNYIVPAKEAGLIGRTLFVTGDSGLDERPPGNSGPTILNIDLDFFAPEMEIDWDRARHFLDAWMGTASLVTIATSPYFIEQDLAIGVLRRIEDAPGV